MSKTGEAVLPYNPYAVKDTLPDVPSEFIAVLLRGIKAMERSKRYRINLGCLIVWLFLPIKTIRWNLSSD